MFASDSMIDLKTTGRKDDLESLMYILCFLNKGTLPIIDFINDNIANFHMSIILKKVLKYREEHREKCHKKLKALMPEQVRSSFSYII